MTITELLNSLKIHQPNEPSEAIHGNIQQIKAICYARYSNQSFYGNAALNRQMLLDPDIAKLLTPEVLTYLFTHEPTSGEKIYRNSGGAINLRDAIYYGFHDGLDVIRHHA
ncbi:hypothetical protein [Legionella sp. W05-934-2]|jgi:hypothetical protein|uniref:hypothetical protein n=1 Tax=Legionella sp. W05-934-2 TaxID=1198649 RepID=UPI003462ECF3